MPVMRIPRWSKLAIGWTMAAVFAVALSWAAVAQVRNRVIQPSTPIPATTLAAPSDGATTSPPVIRLEPEPDTATSAVGAPPDQTATSISPTTSSTNPQTGATGGQTTTPSSTTTTSPQTTSSTPTTTTTTTSTTSPPSTTSTTTTVPPETQTSSYQVIGGTVTISYSPGVVTFVSAIPQPGFSTDIHEVGPDRVRVQFESDDHTSEFRAEWNDGELRITKDEDD